jgi:uncharacterized protein YbjQ (UPF0145 family)
MSNQPQPQDRRNGVIVVTTETIPGFHVVRVVGEVLGVAARSKSPYAEGFISLRDGSGVTPEHRRELLSACRWEAVEDMKVNALHLGANAIVAMRFDHRQVTATWIEVCAYGTAVVMVPAGTRPMDLERPLVATHAVPQ